jgi:hypothetical protein
MKMPSLELYEHSHPAPTQCTKQLLRSSCEREFICRSTSVHKTTHIEARELDATHLPKF